ncbi:ABC transporter permease [Acrocarpospora pleiomorpha]|uniref:ABC transporter permease n=1 Tax=Acrocarpospora pleiomorpha TaxID=90975 RepID=A0A5M3XR41_9ACTN|nr:iron chelate uptake ABC transporter family permease subunit [Acrocarpospora pleiomorpha]GES21633.1 ABC transporter permease [Acrocarpospora pleiomorpha]
MTTATRSAPDQGTPVPSRWPRATLTIVSGSLILPVAIVVASIVGAAGLSSGDVLRTIAVHVGVPVEPLPALDDGIIWELRLPRVLLAVLVGGGLAVCGAVLQALTRNPLADPYLLGVSSGASTGAVLVLVLGVWSGAAALSAGAFAGSLLAFCCVLAVIRMRSGGSVWIVLAGVVVSQMFSALTSLIVIWAGDAQSTRGVTFWLLGSLASATWTGVALCALVTAAGVLWCWAASPALDAFAFGREAAASLGIAPARTELALFVATALTTAVVVSASGAIGFVGLVVPHAVRALVGSRHRRLLPACALYGGILLLGADTVARTAFTPREIPVGVLTALTGVPVFAVIMWRRRDPAG